MEKFVGYEYFILSWHQATKGDSFESFVKTAALRDLVRSMDKPGPIIMVEGKGSSFAFVAMQKDESVQSAVRRAVEMMNNMEEANK